MKKRKIFITVLTLSIALFTTIFVLAEYYYQRTIQDQDVGLGKMSLKSSSYLDYAQKDDNGYTTTRLDEPEKISASQRITCYATEKTGYTGENEYMSLNQLGFEFTYTNTVDVYIRVQVFRGWISRKYYAGSQEAKNDSIPEDNTNRYSVARGVTEDNYSAYYTLTATKATTYSSEATYYTLNSSVYVQAKGVTSQSFGDSTYYTLNIAKATSYSSTATYYYNSNSPFSVQDDNWFYDNTSGYIYYKVVSEGSNEEKTLSFDIDEIYTYILDGKTIGYREAILVDVGFSIDMIQANRAKKKWGIDMESYFD